MYELFLFFICIDAQFTPQTDNHEFGLTRLLSSAFTSSSYVCGVSSATSQTMVSTSIQRAGRGGTVIPPLGKTQLSVLPVNALINS